LLFYRNAEKERFMRILLAEDDKNYGMVLKRELEEDCHVVHWVVNGVEAVLAFLEKPYEVVLLDLRMPRLSGNDALRILKKIKPEAPVMTIGGKVTDEEKKESLECGAINCFTKPFPLQNLKDELRRHIRE
jgi:two-component system capsular synthesis sensor histidine kinase RcsC